MPTLGRLEAAAVLVPGKLGTFDDSGVTMSCVVAQAGRRYLYYADPRDLFDHCKRHVSRFVSVLHDTPLYEFTLIVRL